MAEILVKVKDSNHPDPWKDRRGCYKRGMPVAVMPDGHEWGREEAPPTFAIIKLPGIPVENVRKYVEPELAEAIEVHTWTLEDLQAAQLSGDYKEFLSAPASLGEYVVEGKILVDLEGPVLRTYRRRLWHISWADLPQETKDKLTSEGQLTIKAGTYSGPYDFTWAQVQDYFKQVTSGTSETEVL